MKTLLSGPLTRLFSGTCFASAALALVASTPFSFSGFGATRVVTNLVDAGSGSLREEIAAATNGDTVIFDVNGTISLTNGELLINKDLVFKGPGPGNLLISGNTNSRVFRITEPATVSLSGLSICDGRAENGTVGFSNNPDGGNGGDGGGIYNAGALTLTQCVVSNCAAGGGGAGYSDYRSSIPDAVNWVGGHGGSGGAIYNSGTLLLLDSTFTSNSSGTAGQAGGTHGYGAQGTSGGGGGAIYNAGVMTLVRCVLEHNVAGNAGGSTSGASAAAGAGGPGGAICDAGRSRTFITDCQFSFNMAGLGADGSSFSGFLFQQAFVGGPGGVGAGGGAIWTQAPLQINDCTFLSNQAGSAGAGGEGTPGGAGGTGGPGGAICALGELNLIHCSCVSNLAGSGGGGGLSSGSPYSNGGGAGGAGGSGGALYCQGALRLQDCTFHGNSAGRGGQGAGALGPGDGGVGGSGGAVFSHSNLAASRCDFNGNAAGDAEEPGLAYFNPSFGGPATANGSNGGEAGAIFAIGPIVLHACTLTKNLGGNGSSAGGTLGFIAAIPHPDFIFYRLVGGPGGAGGTGGIYTQSTLAMSLCTLSGNLGGSGASGGRSGGGFMGDDGPFGGAGGIGGPGAVFCASNQLFVIACTIAGNEGGPGGAGGPGGTRHSGQSGNGPNGVGGVGGMMITNAVPAAWLLNTIVAGNISGTGAPSDLQGAFNSAGHNLIGSADGSPGFQNGVNGDIVGSAAEAVDPLLAPPSSNGGTSATLALLHGSPAIDSGDDSLLGAPYGFETDQRGFPRRSGSHVDIGAFEAQFGAYALLLTTRVTNQSGELHLSGTNYPPGATFSVLGSTNLAVQASWQLLGPLTETAPGQFFFNDAQMTNFPQRFYRLTSP